METIILGLLCAAAVFILIVMFTEFLNFAQTNVPFVPTAKADLAFMVTRAGIMADDYFYDLGSGNGKVVFAIEELAGARAKGIQRGGWTQWYAQLRSAARRIFKKKDRTEFVTGNFFNHQWSEATVIYAYLYPFLMRSVEEKFLEECKPGTKLIVRDFYLPNLKHVDTWETPTKHNMYLYIIQ